eukprot:1159483-Pelagomonas_calceolata.AAC.24
MLANVHVARGCPLKRVGSSSLTPHDSLHRRVPRTRCVQTRTVHIGHIERSVVDKPEERKRGSKWSIPAECIALIYPTAMSIGALQLGLTNVG